MHPLFAETTIRHREHELERRLRRARPHREDRPREPLRAEPVTIRLARPQDELALSELAQLEGRPVPEGACVVAEVGGAVVAALPLEAGSALGNPFRRTAHLIPLLELRARQLAAGPPRRRPIALWGAIRGWSRV